MKSPTAMDQLPGGVDTTFEYPENGIGPLVFMNSASGVSAVAVTKSRNPSLLKSPRAASVIDPPHEMSKVDPGNVGLPITTFVLGPFLSTTTIS